MSMVIGIIIFEDRVFIDSFHSISDIRLTQISELLEQEGSVTQIYSCT